jgi:hypothetical protein
MVPVNCNKRSINDLSEGIEGEWTEINEDKDTVLAMISDSHTSSEVRLYDLGAS